MSSPTSTAVSSRRTSAGQPFCVAWSRPDWPLPCVRRWRRWRCPMPQYLLSTTRVISLEIKSCRISEFMSNAEIRQDLVSNLIIQVYSCICRHHPTFYFEAIDSSTWGWVQFTRLIQMKCSNSISFGFKDLIDRWIYFFSVTQEIWRERYKKKTCASTFWAPTREEIDRLCIKSVVCASVWQIPSKTIENLNFIQVNFSWKSSKFAVNGPFNITLMNFMNTLFTFSIKNSTDVEISWMYNETINIQQS